jgi:hypothetical protein
MLLTLTMNVGLGLQNLKNPIGLGLKGPLLLGWGWPLLLGWGWPLLLGRGWPLLLGWGWPLLLGREPGGLLAVGAVGASARGHLAVTILTEPAGASVAN